MDENFNKSKEIMKKHLKNLCIIFTVVFLLTSCFGGGKHAVKVPEPVTKDIDLSSLNYNYKVPNYINALKADEPGEKQLEIFRVEAPDTGEVEVYCHVLDSQGNYYYDILNNYDICIKEDNTIDFNIINADEIILKDEVNLKASIVLDHSGSIGNTRAVVIQKTIKDLIDKKQPEDKFSLTIFDHRVRTASPLESDKSTLYSAVPSNGIDGFGGATALYDAIDKGIDNLISGGNDTRKALIVFTDGFDNASNLTSNSVLKKAKLNNISVFPVSFGSKTNHVTLGKLAQYTGGHQYQIYNTKQIEGLFQDIYMRLKNYLVIRYNVEDYGYHYLKLGLCPKDTNGTPDLTDNTSFVICENGGCPEDDCLLTDLHVVGVDLEGNEIPNPSFVVEEVLSEKYEAILPYIFFNHGESILSRTDESGYEQYELLTKEQATEVNINTDYIGRSALTPYNNILNIIGVRMLNMQEAKLHLIGCNSGAKEASKGGKSLSKKRAESVKNYLTNIFGITTNRIIIEPPRNLPVKRTAPKHLYGIEENRRVEMWSDNPRILAPLLLSDTSTTTNPPTIRFYPTIIPDNGYKDWELSCELFVDKLTKDVVSKFGTTILPKVEEWDLNIPRSKINDTPGSSILKNQLVVTERNSGRKCSSDTVFSEIKFETLEWKKKNCINEMVVEEYSLVLFKINSTKLIDTWALDSLVLPNIHDIAKEVEPSKIVIMVKGFTDRLGNAKSNMILSKRRSIAVAGEIKEILIKEGISGPKVIHKWYGEDMGIANIYNNELPQGRMYCRTVIIQLFYPRPLGVECD